MCGSQDRHEAARAPGAAGGSGLPPVNDCDPKGLRGAERDSLGLVNQLNLLVLLVEPYD